MNKRNNIIIVVLTIIILIMVGIVSFLIFNKGNTVKVNEEVKPKVIQEQDLVEKPRFNGITLDKVKTICDARSYFNDLKNSDFENIKKINFDDVKQVMEQLPKEKGFGPASESDYYDYKRFAERYKEIIENSKNKKEFLNNQLELQDNINGTSISNNRFYKCE